MTAERKLFLGARLRRLRRELGLNQSAMAAEIGVSVRQEQLQYQSSELLIGAIYGGWRITERPVVMHARTAGASKKGNNALYGLSLIHI